MTAVELKKKKSVRLWAVVFWLLVWQGASMALAALYPHGALLLGCFLIHARHLKF